MLLFAVEEMGIIERILERFGMPTLIILGGAWALWRTARWFGQKIAEPLVTSHVSLVTAVQANDTQITENQKTALSLLEQMAKDAADVKVKQAAIVEHQTQIANQTQTLAVHQTKLVTVVTDALIEKCSVPHCPIIAALRTIKQQRADKEN